MKKTFSFFMLFAIVLIWSCKNSGKSATASDSATVAAADTLTYPYKATYTSSVTFGSPKNSQLTLQSYKDWEDNHLTNAPAYFADTVTMIFPDGTRIKMGRDSLVRVFQKYRDSLITSKLEIEAWTSLHSTDKNEDWVNVWYKQTDHYKTGKIDSAIYQDDNRIVNGKIDYVSSKMQKFKKMK
jgi:hypothetical protein